MSTWRVLVGDCRESLRTLPDASVQCVVTSPPYWGLRDYGHAGQLGLERTPDEYVAKVVDVFREVRRVLRDDGTLWLNLGDSYAASGRGGNPIDSPHQKQATNRGSTLPAGLHESQRQAGVVGRAWCGPPPGFKQKDLCGIPWMVALALRSDGWYLRSDIIWAKPNPMPESVTDRPTKAHEYVFLLSKSASYYYDTDAIAEPASCAEWPNVGAGSVRAVRAVIGGGDPGGQRSDATTRNARSVWSIATMPYAGAHFATFPPELAERCILAGSKPGDTVLDPFAGSGTTGMVATGHGRSAILCELNPEYVHLIRERCGPMLEVA